MEDFRIMAVRLKMPGANESHERDKRVLFIRLPLAANTRPLEFHGVLLRELEKKKKVVKSSDSFFFLLFCFGHKSNLKVNQLSFFFRFLSLSAIMLAPKHD